ncbi:sphingomyelin phosphodiesterase [Streptomyces sp. S816]|uniref:sphingomyelin phosphodiesterase n=1 Tax=Streptomyces sp. S816 TaxID=2283197 RepID=UPI00109D7802|nr:sphingomyelin phosphodiesterase [Streptomyces sp. S816]
MNGKQEHCPKIQEETVRILNYNTMLLTFAGNYAHEKRARLIGDADFMQGNDVIVLEEVFRNQEPAANILLNTLKSHGYIYQTPIVGANNKTGWDSSVDNASRVENGGVVIVSKHPIEYQAEHIYNAQPCGSDKHSEKGFAYVRINVNGTRLHVIGTHTQSDDTGCPKAGDNSAPSIRQKQFREIDQFISVQNIPKGETIVISGDMNVDRHSAEYSSMLSTLHAERPDHNLGWPYSFDTQNNTIAKERYGQHVQVYAGNDPSQDLDHILLRQGHARPLTWNNKTLTKQYDWDMVGNTGQWYGYSDYSDHYPVVAGDVTEPTGTYELAVEKATLKRYEHNDNSAVVYGDITITGASESGRDRQILWYKNYSESASPAMKVGADFPLSPHRTVRSDHGFAVHVDVLDYHSSPFVRNETVAYGTAWWHNGDPEGRHTAILVGAYRGVIEVTYNVRKL